ncbi:MAG: hypothetical protein OXC63_11890 [Aestuariivita sp.]|nr:hypothetical protein [Aestuariivita sp.]MCY4345914.1 hypothetical protein [Aestuariivita sp.]
MDDKLHLVDPKAAGIDIHKMAITVSTRLVDGAGAPQTATDEFSALPSGIIEIVAWRQAQQIAAALLEGTGIEWAAPFDTLAKVGIELILVPAHSRSNKSRDAPPTLPIAFGSLGGVNLVSRWRVSCQIAPPESFGVDVGHGERRSRSRTVYGSVRRKSLTAPGFRSAGS